MTTRIRFTGFSTHGPYQNFVISKTHLTILPCTAEKLAFFINIYNALIVHGTVVWGSPSSLLKRLSFFGDVCYNIGGHRFSADDIEHGILRDNAPSPASLGSLLNIGFLKKPLFSKGDARRDLCVSPVDPRIHFALVCGAKSCPAIKLYTPDNLDLGLQVCIVLSMPCQLIMICPDQDTCLLTWYTVHGRQYPMKHIVAPWFIAWQIMRSSTPS
jgi:hypothetical protein